MMIMHQALSDYESALLPLRKCNRKEGAFSGISPLLSFHHQIHFGHFWGDNVEIEFWLKTKND